MSQKPDHYVGGWSDADSRPVTAAPAAINHCAVFCGEACDCAWRDAEAERAAVVARNVKAGRAC